MCVLTYSSNKENTPRFLVFRGLESGLSHSILSNEFDGDKGNDFYILPIKRTTLIYAQMQFCIFTTVVQSIFHVFI